MSISFEKSFGYVFKDPEWVKKILIGTAFVLLTPFMIGIPFTTGYVMRIIRHRLQGKEGLPGWENLGDLFVDGIKLVFIGFLFSLPLVVIWFGMAILMFVLGEINEDLASVVALLFLPIQGLSMLYSLAITLIHPHIYYVIATDRPIRQAFQLKGYFRMLKTEWSSLLIALLFTWLAGVLAWFGIFVFFVGFFLALAYINAVVGDIYGRLLADWKQRKLLAE